MKQTDLAQILADHRLWLDGKGGKQADLSGFDLRSFDLRGFDLRYAILRGTDLSGTELNGTDLSGAILRGANLRGVNFRGAYLWGADLRDADLRDANFRGAVLIGADLRDAGLIVLQLPIWVVYVHRNTVRIECQHHSHDDWRHFTDEEINQMDPKALPWWRAHKSIIFAAMDAVASKQEKSNE